jgi:hypothetical protein
MHWMLPKLLLVELIELFVHLALEDFVRRTFEARMNYLLFKCRDVELSIRLYVAFLGLKLAAEYCAVRAETDLSIFQHATYHLLS